MVKISKIQKQIKEIIDNDTITYEGTPKKLKSNYYQGYETGNYIGDGTTNRTITTSKTPQVIIVNIGRTETYASTRTGLWIYANNTNITKIIDTSSTQTGISNNEIILTTNGFIVNGQLNITNELYGYIYFY